MRLIIDLHITPINVHVQQCPKVIKALLVTIIGRGMEESWDMVLMQKYLQTSSGKALTLLSEIKMNSSEYPMCYFLSFGTSRK